MRPSCFVELYDDREAWLEGRKMGGSDAWSCLFQPFPLWCEKTGRIEPMSDELRFRVGHDLEGPISREAASLGLQLWDPGVFTMFRSRQRSWQKATLDRLWFDEEIAGFAHHRQTVTGIGKMLKLAKGHCEIKTVSEFAVGGEPPYSDWSEDEPATYATLQAQHNLSVIGKDHALIIALVGFGKLWIYELERHDRLIELLNKAEQRFWEAVTYNVQPPVDDSERTAAILRKLFGKSEETEIAVTDEWALPLMEVLELAKASRKKAEVMVRGTESIVKGLMKTNAIATAESGAQFTWRTDKAGRRPLRIKRR